MYIVMELQKTNDQLAHLFYTYQDRNEAESKYHLILSAAAISDIPVHSAILMDEKGSVFMKDHYEHYEVVVPDPEELEPEPEGE